MPAILQLRQSGALGTQCGVIFFCGALRLNCVQCPAGGLRRGRSRSQLCGALMGKLLTFPSPVARHGFVSSGLFCFTGVAADLLTALQQGIPYGIANKKSGGCQALATVTFEDFRFSKLEYYFLTINNLTSCGTRILPFLLSINSATLCKTALRLSSSISCISV